MRDRESTFSDPRVQKLLQARFVATALDCHYWRSRDDRDGEIYRAMAKEARPNSANKNGKTSTQGHYIITASGRLLAAHNRRGAEAALALCAKALKRLEDPTEATKIEPRGRQDKRYARRLPDGGLSLEVHTRASAWKPELQTDRSAAQRSFMRWNSARAGFDHLWIWPRELAALAPGARPIGASYAAPRALVRRIARFHLTDNVRGEPPMFKRDEVERAALQLTVIAISGARVTLSARGRVVTRARNDFGPLSFDGTLLGELCYDLTASRFVSVALLAEGRFEGRGRWTPGAPQGPFTLSAGFEIPPGSFAVEIPPQGIRDLLSYRLP